MEKVMGWLEAARRALDAAEDSGEMPEIVAARMRVAGLQADVEALRDEMAAA